MSQLDGDDFEMVDSPPSTAYTLTQVVQQLTELNRQIALVRKAMLAQMREDLGIKSPSKVMRPDDDMDHA